MKINSIYYFLLLSIFSVITCSCYNSSKDSTEINKIISTLSPLDSLYSTVHNIDTKKSNFLKGKNGVCVYIPANAIDNPSDGKAIIIIKEYLSEASIVNASLSTLSNGQLLETDGMIHLSILSDGKELKLKNNESITVLYPKNEKNSKKRFLLFYGEKDSLSNINWIPAPFDKNKFNKDSSQIVLDTSISKYEIKGSNLITIYTPEKETGMTYYDDRYFDYLKLKDGSSATIRYNELVDSMYSKEEAIYLFKLFENVLHGISFNVSPDGSFYDFKVDPNFKKHADSDTMKSILAKLTVIAKKYPLMI